MFLSLCVDIKKMAFNLSSRGDHIARIAIKNDITISKLSWEKHSCLQLFEKACSPAALFSALSHYTGAADPDAITERYK